MKLRLAELPKLIAKGSYSSVYGILIILTLWAGVWLKYVADIADDAHDADRTARNAALVFEENALRSIGEIDKALLYLRRSIETRGATTDLTTIANTTDVLSEIIVQVAILDAKGIQRASNAGPQPAPPTDLSDREHFKVHLRNSRDSLFISKPLIGRTSRRWSVQFSRRYSHPDGSFAGVVVASLDPAHFTKFYDKVDLGASASIALIGSDGIVRSSGGNEGGFALGEDLSGTAMFHQIEDEKRESVTVQYAASEPRIVALRKVRGQPLWVSVSLRQSDIYKDSGVGLWQNSAVVTLLTLLILVAMERMLRVEAKRSEAEAHVAQLAAEDPLTGLPNRRVFRLALDTTVERHGAGNDSSRATFAVMFLDLDRFKLINDTVGHTIGDKFLTAAAARIKAELGHGELLARLGGDEFAILVPDATNVPALEELAGRIIAAVAQPFEIGGHQLRSGVSIGIALGPLDGTGSDELLMAADVALYAVKAKSRGSHAFFSSSMTEELALRRELESDLRIALAGKELRLEYQPVIDTRRQSVVGFEALARWNHPVRGPISPEVFIPLAEECGLIHALGEWALEQACREAVRWPEHLTVAVNLSPVQFVGTDLLGLVTGILRDTKLPPHRLELEITESVFLEESDETLDVLRELRSIGVRIALDDFGTGYSSLRYLRSFPFDKIKVDRAFVVNLGHGAEHTALVKAVIDLAKALGMATTAEGVETGLQQSELTTIGCDHLQGYLFSKPVPSSRIEALIHDGERRSALAA